jgi:peptidoglycan/xylan/chitin deacetylase (PgdA/CDA1 family)
MVFQFLETFANKLDFCQTFDDGPTTATAALLDFLDSVNQKTTFFEIGSQVIENYQVTQREYASGHEIGVHTWSHPDLTTLTPQQVYAELAWASYAIWAAIGQTPKLFRPPFGFINDNVRQVSAQLGMTVYSRIGLYLSIRLYFGQLIRTIGRLDQTMPILFLVWRTRFKGSSMPETLSFY